MALRMILGKTRPVVQTHSNHSDLSTVFRPAFNDREQEKGPGTPLSWHRRIPLPHLWLSLFISQQHCPPVRTLHSMGITLKSLSARLIPPIAYWHAKTVAPGKRRSVLYCDRSTAHMICYN